MRSDDSEAARRTPGVATEHLRILIANEHKDRLDRMADIVTQLDHEIVVREHDVASVAELTQREQPDLAFVGLGEDSQHALDMISKIVREATCPVITVLDRQSPEFIREAAKEGVFGYVTDREPEALQSAIEIVLRRFTEYHSLQGAFGRRAVIERAKGILMDRHQVDEESAFSLLRGASQRERRKIVEVAQGVVDNHLLLPGPRSQSRATALQGADVSASPPIE